MPELHKVSAHLSASKTFSIGSKCYNRNCVYLFSVPHFLIWKKGTEGSLQICRKSWHGGLASWLFRMILFPGSLKTNVIRALHVFCLFREPLKTVQPGSMIFSSQQGKQTGVGEDLNQNHHLRFIFYQEFEALSNMSK